MDILKKNITSILVAIFVVVAILVFYAPMYAYQEGMQIFMADSTFFEQTCCRPGGLCNYIGSFLVQFFMYPQWLVLVMLFFIVEIQRIAKNIFSRSCTAQCAEILSVVCASAVMAVATDYNMMFSGIVAIFLSLAAVEISKLTRNSIILICLTPLVYWVVGGWCCIIYIIGIIGVFDFKQSVATALSSTLLMIFCWVITKRIIADESFAKMFVGVDFFRSNAASNTIWYVGIAVICICMLVSKYIKLPEKQIVGTTVYIVSFVGLLAMMYAKYDKSMMLDFKIDRMVRHKRWKDIVATMSDVSNASPMSLCYLNVALNELGIMDSKMFNFAQIGVDGLASTDINSLNKSIYNSEIFFRLGLLNVAERFAIDAVESNDTHNKSARQYKRLAEINIIRGNKQLAMRYLNILKCTTFYSAWANRAVCYLADSVHTDALADWKISQLQMSNDIFFSEQYGAELYLNLLANNPHDRKVLNYYLCYLLLEKNIEQVYDFLDKYRTETELGVHIYEAILLYLFKNKKEEFNKMMTQKNDMTARFGEFVRYLSSADAQNEQKAKELFGKSYWYYYYYK